MFVVLILGFLSALDQSVPRRVAWRELEAVKADVRAVKAAGGTPLVVFDIDETLIISDRGMHWDPKMRVLPGAIEYIDALIAEGARIVYLTGRKKIFTKPTLAELKRLKLPMGPQVKLILNDTPWRGFVFKGLFRERLLKLGTPVAFFENEKDIARLMRMQYPWARVFRLNTRAKYQDWGRGARGMIVIDDYRKRMLRDQRPRVRAQTRPR